MKYIFLAVVTIGLAGAWYGLRSAEGGPQPAAQIETVAAAPEKVNPKQANGANTKPADMDALIKEVAEAKLDLPPPPRGLSEDQLAHKITEIDDQIRTQHYVERGNRGELSAKELIAFRRLLALRNQYYEQKIELMLNES